MTLPEVALFGVLFFLLCVLCKYYERRDAQKVRKTSRWTTWVDDPDRRDDDQGDS